jgi:hypothetical protein
MTAADQAVEDTADRLEQHVTDLEANLARAHADCWVPIPLRWRHVRPGDVVVLKDKLWEVTATDMHEQWAEAFVARGEKTHRADLDPDATVPVLVRHQEREALQTAREQLGATVVDRRV